MNKSNRSHWAIWLLSINAAILMLFNGCATQKEHSFNGDFGQNMTSDPKYFIYDEDSEHFRIEVHQGTPSTGADRILDLKKAATTIAEAECQRLEWKKWQSDFIQERNQGWMHIVILEVKKKEYTEPNFPKTGSNP